MQIIEIGWQDHDGKAPALVLTEVVFDEGRIAAVIEPTPIRSQAFPSQYTLGQNYPNPFNPDTEIKYGLAAGGPVRLVIYNLLGQEVRTLVDGVQAAGYYQVLWDGRNQRGRTVGSGVYLYRITAGDYSESRRMVLLK